MPFSSIGIRKGPDDNSNAAGRTGREAIKAFFPMLEKGIPRDFFRTKGRPLSHLYRASANTMDSLPGECRVSPSMKRVKISPKANISRQKYHGRKPVDFYFIHTKRYIKVKQKLFAKQHSREISPAFRFSFE